MELPCRGLSPNNSNQKVRDAWNSLIAALNDLRPRFAGGAAQYYLAAITACLEAGLLFGGLCVSLALL